jgi:hypothetical protein
VAGSFTRSKGPANTATVAYQYDTCSATDRSRLASNGWAGCNDAPSDVGRVCWLIALNPLGAASAAKGRSIRERSVQVLLLPGAELWPPGTATVAVAIARRVRPSDEAVGESWSGLVSGTLPL